MSEVFSTKSEGEYMPELDVTQIKVGDHLKFKTMNSRDLVYWEGRVVSILGYEDAITQEDILPYYWESKKSNPNLAIPEELTYFKLRVFENNDTLKRIFRIFSLQYIDVSTLRINDVYNDISIRVYSVPNEEQNTIINILKTHGYVARVMT